MTVPLSARLSSQSTSTLSKILELTRLHQNNLSVPDNLPTTISRNLSQLRHGIKQLEHDQLKLEMSGAPQTEVKREEDVLVGLQSQYGRLTGLVDGLGVHVERDEGEEQEQNKNTAGPSLPSSSSSSPKLGPQKQKQGPEPYRDYPNEDEDDNDNTSSYAMKHIIDEEADLDRRRRMSEHDESTIRQADHDILSMQHQMYRDQDEQLDNLSIAISRQRDLSSSISNELELQSSLLSQTDDALDRTQLRLGNASNHLDKVRKGIQENGATWTIVALVVILLILVLVFKT